MSVAEGDFVRAILDPEAAVPDGLTNPDGAQAAKRFDVYRNNVAVSLTEALETAFPVIRKLLGEANFKMLAGVYLRRHPPGSALMMLYGAEMPAFLTSFEPVAGLPYLPDVARLELALRESYHAADAPALDPKVLQQMPPDRLMAARVLLAPAMRLIRSRWPVHAIWARNMEDGPKPGTGGQNVLIARPDFDPVMSVLPPGGGAFMAALMDGATFGTALDTALERVPDFDLSAMLGILFAGGAIIDLKE